MNARKIKHLLLLTVLATAIMMPGQLISQSAIGTVVTLTGYMLDQATLEPVESNYSVMDETGKKIGRSRKASATDGYLVTGLQPGKTYTIRVEDPRYFKQEYKLVLPSTNKYAEVSHDVVVQKMAAGKKLMVSPSPFDLKKTELKVGVEEDLREMAKILMMNPGVKIELICYPDEQLPANRSAEFSGARGESLKSFLEQQGVNGTRISVKRANSTDPLNPPPLRKGAKGKRYIGPVYMVITSV